MLGELVQLLSLFRCISMYSKCSLFRKELSTPQVAVPLKVCRKLVMLLLLRLFDCPFPKFV
jgi:hypothetical protein